jgi:hypothetical protein
MSKKKMTRDVPLPSSDGMFGGIKGRSLKAATPGIPTATIKTFRNIGDDKINYNSKKVPADRTGRAMGDFPNDDYAHEISSSGGNFGRSRYKNDLKAVSAAGTRNKIAQRRQQIYKKVDANMAAKKK